MNMHLDIISTLQPIAACIRLNGAIRNAIIARLFYLTKAPKILESSEPGGLRNWYTQVLYTDLGFFKSIHNSVKQT